MNTVVGIAHLAIIAAIGFRLYSRAETLRPFFWPALLVKLLSGVCLGLLYTYYYPVADTFTYFNDASMIASIAKSNVGKYLSFMFSDYQADALGLVYREPRAVFLSKLTSIFNLLTGNNYWAISFYFSLISFTGAWFLVCLVSRNMPQTRNAAIGAFLFLPSVVFWTSGLLKESLAMGALFFLTGVVLKMWFNEKLRWWQVLLAVMSFWISWKLKYYYTGIFAAVVFTAFVFRFIVRNRPVSAWIEGLIWSGILVIALGIVSFLHPNFHTERLMNVIVENNEAYNALSSPDNVVTFRDLQPTGERLLLNAPWALFSGLFRPLFWEVESFVQVLAGVENTIVLLLFALSLRNLGTYPASSQRILILSAVVYVTALSVLLTMSAPNFGTLSRYRVGYISFFAFIVLCNNPVMQYLERSLPWLARK